MKCFREILTNFTIVFWSFYTPRSFERAKISLQNCSQTEDIPGEPEKVPTSENSYHFFISKTQGHRVLFMNGTYNFQLVTILRREKLRARTTKKKKKENFL